MVETVDVDAFRNLGDVPKNALCTSIANRCMDAVQRQQQQQPPPPEGGIRSKEQCSVLFRVILPWEKGRVPPVRIYENTWTKYRDEFGFGSSVFKQGYEDTATQIERQYEVVRRKHAALPKNSPQRPALRALSQKLGSKLLPLRDTYMVMEFLDTLGRCKDGECLRCGERLPCPNEGCGYHSSTLGSKYPLLPIPKTTTTTTATTLSSSMTLSSSSASESPPSNRIVVITGKKPGKKSFADMIQGKRKSATPTTKRTVDLTDGDEDGDGEGDEGTDDFEGEEVSREYASSEEEAYSNDEYDSDDDYFKGASNESTDDGCQSDYEHESDKDAEEDNKRVVGMKIKRSEKEELLMMRASKKGKIHVDYSLPGIWSDNEDERREEEDDDGDGDELGKEKT